MDTRNSIINNDDRQNYVSPPMKNECYELPPVVVGIATKRKNNDYHNERVGERVNTPNQKTRTSKGIMRIQTLEESLDSCSDYNDDIINEQGRHRSRRGNRQLKFNSGTNKDDIKRRNSIATSCVSSLTGTTEAFSSTIKTTTTTATANSNTCTNTMSTQRKKTVSFSNIMIRQYNVTIGDNPSCSRGAPLMLHWSYNPDTIISTVDLYEKFREVNPPRKRSQMIIPMKMRHEMLKFEWNIGTSEILNVIREIKVIQQQRYKSAVQQERRIRAEALLENAKNSVRNLVVK